MLCLCIEEREIIKAVASHPSQAKPRQSLIYSPQSYGKNSNLGALARCFGVLHRSGRVNPLHQSPWG